MSYINYDPIPISIPISNPSNITVPVPTNSILKIVIIVIVIISICIGLFWFFNSKKSSIKKDELKDKIENVENEIHRINEKINHFVHKSDLLSYLDSRFREISFDLQKLNDNFKNK